MELNWKCYKQQQNGRNKKTDLELETAFRLATIGMCIDLLQ